MEKVLSSKIIPSNENILKNKNMSFIEWKYYD